jgi:site-specific DNA-cytosine methylase
MRILDLFCGAGGFSCGFLDKGNTFVGIDMNETALETYRNNIKGEALNTDVLALDPTTLGHFEGEPALPAPATLTCPKCHDTGVIDLGTEKVVCHACTAYWVKLLEDER